MVKVTIYGSPNTENETREAGNLLLDLGEVTIQYMIVPESVKELYRLPFVVIEESGERFFGLDSIKSFVERRIKNQDTLCIVKKSEQVNFNTIPRCIDLD